MLKSWRRHTSFRAKSQSPAGIVYGVKLEAFIYYGFCCIQSWLNVDTEAATSRQSLY